MSIFFKLSKLVHKLIFSFIYSNDTWVDFGELVIVVKMGKISFTPLPPTNITEHVLSHFSAMSTWPQQKSV